MAPVDFDSRKQAVLAGLSSDSADKSPKGHVDAPVRTCALPIRRHPATAPNHGWAAADVTRWSQRDTHALRRAPRAVAVVGLAHGVMMKKRMPPLER